MISARWIRSEDNDIDIEYLDVTVNSKKWHVDYFVLALEWPEGFCEYVNATSKHECVISDVVKGWVLHGLWPSNYGHRFLQYCNHSAKFDYNRVKDLQVKLNKYWPNLFEESSKVALWKHEYEKHGTCASIIPGFATERDYFVRAMEILQKYNPTPVLEKNGITPRAKKYDSDSIINAFESGFGKGVCTQCSDVNDDQVLRGIEICLTKELEVMKCPHCGTKYACDGPVSFHPLNYGT